MTVDVLDAASVLVVMAATAGYLNHKLLKLPFTIGLMVSALAASLAVMALDAAIPSLTLGEAVRGYVLGIDFTEALMKGMLAFLLFAGALHVNLDDLVHMRGPILSLASVGVVLSTAVMGTASYLVFQLVGIEVPLVWCLVFGALISPTDPVAVLGILSSAKAPKSLETKVAGESLFNDGIGVIVFTVLLGIAVGGASHGHGDGVSAGSLLEIFLVEVVGGLLLGLALGLIVYYAMRTLDEPNLEILLSVALVMAINFVAFRLHTSSPLACVVAGLFLGNRGRAFAMSDRTRDALDLVWSFLDEALNAVLFLLVGLEVFAVSFEAHRLTAALLLVPVALAARLLSVGVPMSLLGLRRRFTPGAVRVLTWGGLKGGISVALALSLPDFPGRSAVLAATYAIVVFSIVVQGLTLGPVVRRLTRA